MYYFVHVLLHLIAATPAIPPSEEPTLVSVEVRFMGDRSTDGARMASFDEKRYAKWCRTGESDPAAQLTAGIAEGLEAELMVFRFLSHPMEQPAAKLVLSVEYYSTLVPAYIHASLDDGVQERSLGAPITIEPGHYKKICGPESAFITYTVMHAQVLLRELLLRIPLARVVVLSAKCWDMPADGVCKRPYLDTAVGFWREREEKIRRRFERTPPLLRVEWSAEMRGTSYIDFVNCIEPGSLPVFRGPVAGHTRSSDAPAGASPVPSKRVCASSWEVLIKSQELETPSGEGTLYLLRFE
ncbi:hypothetical protein [Nannocystis punicea]|uniref:Uncharacterized protein n=1 Tax=Nannocystis punicea TaxID=2995304 RepID=A0ABY7H097_9BACT|nr:hypothetical protein [Nannocystis poenicansa]WAS92454.1 hypothetical protein O0S08_40260 [Nannocystis poenicansa]